MHLPGDMAASTLIILGTISCYVGQVNSISDSSGLQAIIPPNLLDCYRNMTLLTRENLPPMTLNVLLAIIRKLESQPGVYLDMRTLTSQILNSYRMDGIEKNPDVAPSQYVTPYGPSGNQFYRYKILMDGLIPTKTGNTFPTNALTNEEKCSIHLMLSASVDRNERGDESKVCNTLSNYVKWDSRVPRNVRTYEEEVDMVPSQHNEPALGHWMDGGYSGLSCPLENGVVYTRYGAVKFGMVLGGVAAGLQSQTVSRRNLILVAKANSLRGRSYNFPRLYASSDNNDSINNVWAATLSGEVAEIALLQGPLSNNQMRVGLNGGWNDSVLPRYYFLQEDNKDAITDTDLRGSIDGLILGTNVQSWNNQGGRGQIKLSQLLDMYYSERGVFSTNTRACQRVVQFNTMFTPDQIMQQSYAFSGVLEMELPPAVNVEDAGLQNFNSIAVQKLISYLPSMTENQCSFGSTTYSNAPSSGQVTTINNPVVNLYLVIDFSLDYLDAMRIASHLAERLEVSRFTGNISIINAKDGSVVLNSTSNILELYANFTRTNYDTRQRGFDLPRIFRDVGNVLQYRLTLDKQYRVAGGPGSVVLIVPSSSSIVNYNDDDKRYMYNRLSDLKRTVPDTRFMFLASGSKERFTSYVQDSSKDIFTLWLSDIRKSIDSVMARFIEIPRRIINPTCVSFNMWGQASSNLVLRAYIEPVGGIHYYRIHPNYFFQSENGVLRISSPTGRTLNICQSRVNVLPGNNSQSDTCRQITSDTYEVYLKYACGDTSLYNCAPFYFSVAVVPTSSTNINSCTDDNCRYPDNIPVDIRQDGLTCASKAQDIFSRTNLLLISFVALFQIVR